MVADAITSNVKSDKTLVSIKLDNQKNKNKFKEIRRDFRRPGLDWMRLHL